MDALDHPDYARVNLMRLDVRDLASLERCGSPLARACREHEAAAAAPRLEFAS